MFISVESGSLAAKMLAKAILPVPDAVGVDGRPCRGRVRRRACPRSAASRSTPRQFRHGEGDGDVLLERDRAEPADLVVGHRAPGPPRSAGSSAGAASARRMCTRSRSAVTQIPAVRASTATATGRRRPGSDPSRRGGPHGRWRSRRRGADELPLVDLLEVRQHGHALDHECVRTERRGARTMPICSTMLAIPKVAVPVARLRRGR